MTQQGEETADRKGLVAPFQDIIVDGVLVEEVAQEADGAVDGDEEEDADDVFLLPGFEVVGGVHEHEEEADDERDEPEDRGEEKAEVVEGEAFP